ncbi:helix-hairpin-helix domain-containing protein [Ammoniphilus resinae]|uniref:Competence protein ComEA n=1 Tax=Ammoniphilus resinae TaxID=861532 RepID=A0ABS4GK24_9BACL|nr:helix-hairpin-helix domain-containing protein [Ammoniphilus resinae]MBP1930492.1 competence protein ComEA [Ammoniphilus resinae]
MNFNWSQREKSFVYIGIACFILIISMVFYQFSIREDIGEEEDDKPFELVELDSAKKVEDSKDLPESHEVWVDLKGAVKNPGVYQLQEGSRVHHLIEMAGGLLPDAEEKLVNLAQTVQDGEMIYVPKRGEEASALSTAGVIGQQKDDPKVQINTANEAEFDSLPGIGPAKAKAIIEYRETHGAFQELERLKDVPGIGEKIFQQLKDHIRIR